MVIACHQNTIRMPEFQPHPDAKSSRSDQLTAAVGTCREGSKAPAPLPLASGPIMSGTGRVGLPDPMNFCQLLFVLAKISYAK